MRVHASSITKEQRTASGAASVAGTDREGFDKVKGLQDLPLLMGKTGKNHSVQYRAQCASLPYSLEAYTNCLKLLRCLGCSRLLTIATLALMLAIRTMIELVIDLSSVFTAKTEIASNFL
jgi:hypothetical protein